MSMHKNLTKIVEGNWDILKGKVKKEWGKLSDDDLEKIDGSYDKLVGKIKQVYGQTEEIAMQHLQEFLKKSELSEAKNKVEEEAEGLLSTAKDIKDKVEEYVTKSFESIKSTSLHVEEDIVKYVKGNPVKAMLFTALAGALLSRIYFNKKK